MVPSPESWLPASLGVPADLAVGDKGPETEGQIRQHRGKCSLNENKIIQKYKKNTKGKKLDIMD